MDQMTNQPTPTTQTPATEREGWLNVSNAARHAGISRRTVYNWLAASRLEYTRTRSGTIRINPASLFDDFTGTPTAWDHDRASGGGL